MHMRRVSKALCAALSLMLIVNLVGFEAMASEVDGKPEQTSGTAGADQSTEDKDKTGESKEERSLPSRMAIRKEKETMEMQQMFRIIKMI